MNTPPFTPSFKQAFSLVELSIVLVILGLLTGGILMGQSLIRGAELRSLSADLQRYNAAIMTFRDKYFSLPGDMPNAYAFWGVAVGCTNDDTNITATGCNGNGDGNVTSVNDQESARFWQHLALAGLIEGTYTGIWGTSPVGPKLKVGQGETVAAKSWYYRTNHGWVSANGATGDFGLELYVNAGLNVEELWNIDKKMDDSKAAQGKIYAHATSPAGCVTGTSIETDDYNLGTENKCSALFRVQ
jgi:prepilin-type N-terminal cleavage/methylation domain-containing protein